MTRENRRKGLFRFVFPLARALDCPQEHFRMAFSGPGEPRLDLSLLLPGGALALIAAGAGADIVRGFPLC